MKTLDSGYKAEIDQVGEAEWSKLLQRFDDATIYQTWSYGSIRWGENNSSHLVLKKDGIIVSAAQLRIVKLPLVKCGIAYLACGPLWQLYGSENNLENIQQMVRALREEYVSRRGLLLRIRPNEIEGNGDAIRSIYEAEGFRWRLSSYRTLMIDLTLSMEELRKGLARRWRRALKMAAKKGLKVIEGTGDELYEVYIVLYNEMLARKRFVEGVDIKEFRAIQRDLPDPLKMKIMVCEFEGEPVSALVASLIGSTGIGLLGATGKKGLDLGAFHLLNWRMIEWMKECGARWYDFGGYNPDKNPGTATFKAGLSGKFGKDVRYIGQFDACQSLVSSFLVSSGTQLMMAFRKLKSLLNRIRRAYLAIPR